MKFFLTVTIICLSVLLIFECSKDEQVTLTPSDMDSMGTLVGTIIEDDSGAPVPARVYAIGSNDSLYYAEQSIEYDQPRFAARIGYSGKHFTTVGNTFTVHLPAGAATVIVERGKEYIPVEVKIPIEAGTTVNKTFTMKRFVDMASHGWYSGDLHVHRPLNDLGNLMIAEDLNIAVPQTVWGQKREPDLDQWLGKADANGTIAVDSRHIFSVLGHEIERLKSSAVLMHHTGKKELPVSEYENRGMTNVSLITLTHAAGGYAETEKPWWPESHIDIVVGKADFTELANNHLTYKSYLPEHPRLRTEFKSDYPEGVDGYVAYVLDLYYAYLNCGFRIMPSAGSASGVLPNPLGYNRVYVKINGEFTYDNWFKSLKAGHSFTTNGPMLMMAVNGNQPGDTISPEEETVHVTCTVYSFKPLDRLEIVRDGEVVDTADVELTDDYSATIERDIPVTESGWIIARCYEKTVDTARFAHTAPVFIEIPGKPFVPKRYAAEYFLEKTKELVVRAETAEYSSDEARNAAMDVFMEAEELYTSLVERSR